MSTEIITEDGVTVQKGSAAFNYYDRKPGVIMEHPDSSGWFLFRHNDESTTLLNGERICSIQFAIKKGWIPR